MRACFLRGAEHLDFVRCFIVALFIVVPAPASLSLIPRPSGSASLSTTTSAVENLKGFQEKLPAEAPAYACSVTCDVPLESQVELRREGQVQYHVGMGSAGRMATDDRDYMRQKGVLYQSFSPLCGPCNPPDNKELLTGALVTGIGKKYKKTGPQVALRWLVQQGIPVIPKSHVPDHMKENSEIFDFELSEQDMTLLTKAQHPAVGGGPSASDSGDCGIEEELVV
ncbi:unnamed protein product [Durusdinium trenchii]|uniref:NADP-dependent oxidoreductase domain-containing protein n=1 Tax=Durusdinium trenchii TaxID=1381693 RepID=A0ABP0NWL5_9DINO